MHRGHSHPRKEPSCRLEVAMFTVMCYMGSCHACYMGSCHSCRRFSLQPQWHVTWQSGCPLLLLGPCGVCEAVAGSYDLEQLGKKRGKLKLKTQ